MKAWKINAMNPSELDHVSGGFEPRVEQMPEDWVCPVDGAHALHLHGKRPDFEPIKIGQFPKRLPKSGRLVR